MGAARGTTIKDALAKWSQEAGEQPSEAKEVKLLFQMPPIDKMDASLSTLSACEVWLLMSELKGKMQSPQSEKLSLSSNNIEKIANLNGLKNLKILSLGRNNIKNLNGLEAVSDTLLELWISYNNIEKLKGIQVLKKLKVLYMSNNSVKDWNEFEKLQGLPCLEELLFVGNPLEEKLTAEGTWRDKVVPLLGSLRKLDGVPVIKQEEEEPED